MQIMEVETNKKLEFELLILSLFTIFVWALFCKLWLVAFLGYCIIDGNSSMFSLPWFVLYRREP